MRQDDSNEDIKNLKVSKNIIFKKWDFTTGKPYFSRLGGSQEEYERFRKARKRHLKSFKTSKKVPKMEPKNSFWTNFGAEMDPEIEPPKKRKLDQKWNRNWKCIRWTEMGVENANIVNCRCRCKYKSCQMNKRKEFETMFGVHAQVSFVEYSKKPKGSFHRFTNSLSHSEIPGPGWVNLAGEFRASRAGLRRWPKPPRPCSSKPADREFTSCLLNIECGSRPRDLARPWHPGKTLFRNSSCL